MSKWWIEEVQESFNTQPKSFYFDGNKKPMDLLTTLKKRVITLKKQDLSN
jgi:hypothetical protein